jgi:WD40 repeat protein
VEKEECKNTLSGHMEFVWTLLKLNEEKIASASGDDSIRMSNITTGECIYTMEGHAQSIWSLIKISENLIATGGGEDEKVKVWDINSGKCTKVFKGFGIISSLIKFNDNCIIAGSEDSTINVWYLENGVLIKTLKGHSDSVRSLMKLNNRTSCIGSADNTIKIWRNFMND